MVINSVVNKRNQKDKSKQLSQPIDAHILSQRLTIELHNNNHRDTLYQQLTPSSSTTIPSSPSLVTLLSSSTVKLNQHETAHVTRAKFKLLAHDDRYRNALMSDNYDGDNINDNVNDNGDYNDGTLMNTYKLTNEMKDHINCGVTDSNDSDTATVNGNVQTFTANGGNVNDCTSDAVVPSQSKVQGVPYVVLICRRNSHPFQERRLSLDSPVRVGRAVARCKPIADNAIFDCKVLSRNHAMIWYDDGKFYLQDTRSSNGTFINNQRLSNASEESAPKEICSGDIVQFGVEVLENSKKVTHGCIVGTVKLYNADGTEVKPSHDRDEFQTGHVSAGNAPITVTITTQELCKLSQLMSEALHREQILENKLATLQRVVTNAQESADTGWKSLVEEDRLLSRIETLQAKLEICFNSAASKSSDIDDNSQISGLREEMLKLLDDKEKYESAAKEAIQKALEDKLMALTKIHKLERTITSHEDEQQRLKDVTESAQKEIDYLAVRIDELCREIEELNGKLKKSENKKNETIEAAKFEKQILEDCVNEFKLKEIQLNDLVNQLKLMNENSQMTIEQLKMQIVMIKQDKDNRGDSELERDTDTNDNNNDDVKIRDETTIINDLRKELECRNAKCLELNAQIESLNKQQYNRDQQLEKSIDTADNADATDANNSTVDTIDADSNDHISKLQYEKTSNKSIDNVVNDNTSDASHSQISSEIEVLTELLSETRLSKKMTDDELSRVLEELESVNIKMRQLEKDSDTYQQQLNDTRKELSDKIKIITEINSQLENLRMELNDAKQNLNDDHRKLSESVNMLLLKDKEISSLKGLLEEERRTQQKYSGNLEQYRKQLLDAQQLAKQYHAEADHLRKKVYSVNEELRSSHTNLSQSSPSSSSSSSSTPLSDSLKNECSILKTKVQSIESELKLCRDDNSKLKGDYDTLRHSYQRLEKIKEAIESRGDDYWKEQFQAARIETDDAQLQLTSVKEEMTKLLERVTDCSRLNEALSDELRISKDDYEIVSYQSKIASACAIVPLFILLIAILIAYYPSVASITGTADA